MRISRVVGSLALGAALGAGSAWAQYGPYGSPALINMPPAAPIYAAPVVPVAAQQPIQPAPAPLLAQDGGMVVPQEMPLATPAPSVVHQMLQQADPGTLPNHACSGCNQGLCGGYAGDGGYDAIDTCGPMMAEQVYPWFVSAKGLVMGRNRADRKWTTYDRYDESDQGPPPPDVSWEGGGEITFGRRFGCGGGCGYDAGIEVTYWTLGNFEGEVMRLDASTPLQTGLVMFDDPDSSWTGPTSASDFYNDAQEHCIDRRDEIHNVEINLFSTRMIDPCASPLVIDWVAGVRWFRFREELLWDTRSGAQWNHDVPFGWGYDGGRYDAYTRSDVTNDLLGFQLGFNADLYLNHKWKLFAQPKFGIYNNHIEHEFHMFRGDGLPGTAYRFDSQTQSLVPVGDYPFRSDEDSLSFLTEIDLGVEWKFAPRWSATLGYRVLAITGVALADDQIPFYLNDVAEIEDIDTNSNLILHGAFAGLNFNF